MVKSIAACPAGSIWQPTSSVGTCEPPFAYRIAASVCPLNAQAVRSGNRLFGLDHDAVLPAEDFHVVGSAPLSAAIVHARIRALGLDGAIEHDRTLRPGVADADRAGMAANVDVDALEEMAEGDVRLLLTPFRLLLARSVVARLRPDPDRDLRLGRIIEPLASLDNLSTGRFPFVEPNRTMRCGSSQ